MKSKKSFRNRATNYRNANDEIRIKEKKTLNKRNIYTLIEEEEAEINL